MTIRGNCYETSNGDTIEVVKRKQIDGERWCWIEIRRSRGEVDRSRMRENEIVEEVSEGNLTPID